MILFSIERNGDKDNVLQTQFAKLLFLHTEIFPSLRVAVQLFRFCVLYKNIRLRDFSCKLILIRCMMHQHCESLLTSTFERMRKLKQHNSTVIRFKIHNLLLSSIGIVPFFRLLLIFLSFGQFYNIENFPQNCN